MNSSQGDALKTTLPLLPNASFSNGESSPLAVKSMSSTSERKNVSSFLKKLFSKDGTGGPEGVEPSRLSSTKRSPGSSTTAKLIMQTSSVLRSDLSTTAKAAGLGGVVSQRLTPQYDSIPARGGLASHASPARPSPPPRPNTVLLAVAPVLPPNMARASWCMKDYAIVEKMYTGYASTVYKAWCKASGETVCLKVRGDVRAW